MPMLLASCEYAVASERKTTVFLSYSRKDIDFAHRLNEELKQAGFHPLLDKTDIAPGEAWQDRLGKLIAEADVIVFSVSPYSAKSEICKWEISEAERLGKRIIPIIVAKVKPETLPATLTRLNFIFFHGEKFDAAFANLKFAIETDLSWVREHTRLAELASAWDTRKKSNALLLRGPALAEAETWISSQPQNASAPTELHRAFISTSRQNATMRQRYSLVAALLVAVVSLGLFVWGEINRREATAQKERAERNLNTATQTANDIIFELAQKFRGAKGIPIETTKDILGRAAQLQENLLKSGEFLPVLQRGQAVSLNNLSETFRTLGDSDTALGLAEKSAQIMEELIKKDQNDYGWKNDLSVSYLNMARSKKTIDETLPILNTALALLELSVSKQPDNLIWKSNLATVHEDIAQNFNARNQKPQALEQLQKARDLRIEIEKRDPKNQDNKLALSISDQNMGDVLLASARLTDAIKSYMASLNTIQTLANSDPNNTVWQNQLAFSADKLSAAQSQSGNLVEAIKNNSASIAILTALTVSDKGNAEWSRHLANSLYKFSDLQMRMNSLDDAIKSLESAIGISETLAMADPKNVQLQNDMAHGYNKMGNYYEFQKKLDLALGSYNKAYAITEANTEKDGSNNDLRHSLSLVGKSIGDVYASQRKFDEAAKAYDESLRIAESELRDAPKDSVARRQVLVLHSAFGELYALTNQMEKAREIFNSVLRDVETYANQNPADITWQRDLAVSHTKLGDAGENQKQNYEAALKIFNQLKETNRIEPVDLSLIPLLEGIIAKLPPG
jgi:tetratricopeptide (TPR) repeat protein